MSPPSVTGPNAPARDTADGIDFARLRTERHRACLEAMDAARLDALVLGREANARYVSDARRLWTAGARPFGPGCVVIGDTGAVHLLSTWDDGVPPDIGHEQLFGLTWNGAVMTAQLLAIPGLVGARRIGVDGMTPGTARLLAAVAPEARIEDATGILEAIRRVKTADEQACIRTAVAVAESALSHALESLRPGVSGRMLAGRVAEHMAGLGVTIPDLEGAFWSTSPRPGPVGLGRVRPADPGEQPGSPVTTGELPPDALVAAHVGAMFAGYEGVVARTWVTARAGGGVAHPTTGQRRLHDRWSMLREHLMAACRPGRTGGDLLAAYERAGEPVPSMPVAHGVGLGMEPPLVGAGLPADAGRTTTLEPGMVLFVLGQVTEPDTGTVVAGEVVLITDSGHATLTRLGYGPLAGDA